MTKLEETNFDLLHFLGVSKNEKFDVLPFARASKFDLLHLMECPSLSHRALVWSPCWRRPGFASSPFRFCFISYLVSFRLLRKIGWWSRLVPLCFSYKLTILASENLTKYLRLRFWISLVISIR